MQPLRAKSRFLTFAESGHIARMYIEPIFVRKPLQKKPRVAPFVKQPKAAPRRLDDGQPTSEKLRMDFKIHDLKTGTSKMFF